MKTCKHPTCADSCRRVKPAKKIYQLKRSPIKKKKKSTKGIFKLTELIAFTQVVFNKWIRERDKEKGCISSKGPSQQAGHYYAAGSYSGVRFDEINVNGQSVEDNCHKAGNPKDYRKGLIERYGIEAVLELDERAKATKLKKWTREELEAIIEKYRIKN